MIDILKKHITSSDTVFISFPKAGRTWIRFFLAKYFELKNKTPFDLELTEHKLLFSHNYFDIYQDVPGVPSVMFQQQLESKKVVLILRDPRDIAVSYYYHKKLRQKVIHDLTIDEFLLSEIYGIERISVFMLQLLDYYEKDLFANTVTISYEHLLADPLNVFERLLKFIGVEINHPVLVRAVNESSFKHMQEYELSTLSNNIQVPNDRLGLKDWDGNKDALKVRYGKQGSFIEELKPDTIQKMQSGYTQKLIEKLGLVKA